MRFLLSILIWIFFVGGLWAYTAHRDARLPDGPTRVAAPKQLAGEYLLEITPSFSLEKDPFALDLDDGARETGLEVRLNGRALTVDAEKISRGEVIRITRGLALAEGFNEFYVKASPPLAESHLDHGLRIRLLDRGAPVADRTVWGSRGALVAGTVSFTLDPPKEDDHDH